MLALRFQEQADILHYLVNIVGLGYKIPLSQARISAIIVMTESVRLQSHFARDAGWRGGRDT